MKALVALLPIAVILAVVLIAVSLNPRAHALPELPAHMDLKEAAQLHAAIAELRLIEQQAQAQAAPHQRRVAEICARAKIDPAQLGKTVGVDFETGEITRAAPKAGPPAAPPK